MKRGPYKRYDSSFKYHFITGGSPRSLRKLGVPRSTYRNWITRDRAHLRAGKDESQQEEFARLAIRVAQLETENTQLRAKVALMAIVLEFFKVSFRWVRVPAQEDKSSILNAIREASKALGIRQTLGIIQLSRARYYSWRVRERACRLQDYRSCPKKTPFQLTAIEINKMGELLSSERYKHFSVYGLALFASRNGLLSVSPQCWKRIMKLKQWTRNSRRVYTKKTGPGIRALAPNEIWHIDVTRIQMQNRQKAYLQVVLDNYSRLVLGWKLSDTVNAQNSYDLLSEVLGSQKHAIKGKRPNLYMDSGIENRNRLVDEIESSGLISKTVAQVDVAFSNSMIEAFFKKLKNDYLYKISLSSDQTALHGVIEYFIQDYNEIMPHRSLLGATPREVYNGIIPQSIANEIRSKIQQARLERIKYHQAIYCPCS